MPYRRRTRRNRGTARPEVSGSSGQLSHERDPARCRGRDGHRHARVVPTVLGPDRRERAQPCVLRRRRAELRIPPLSDVRARRADRVQRRQDLVRPLVDDDQPVASRRVSTRWRWELEVADQFLYAVGVCRRHDGVETISARELVDQRLSPAGRHYLHAESRVQGSRRIRRRMRPAVPCPEAERQRDRGNRGYQRTPATHAGTLSRIRRRVVLRCGPPRPSARARGRHRVRGVVLSAGSRQGPVRAITRRASSRAHTSSASSPNSW